MGMDIGIINIEVLPRPGGIVYDFMQRMAVRGARDAYMWGEGHSYIPFTQRQVLRMLDRFTQRRGLSPEEREEILAWLTSLPWIGGWQDTLPSIDDDEEEDEYDDERNGGLIELYFNW